MLIVKLPLISFGRLIKSGLNLIGWTSLKSLLFFLLMDKIFLLTDVDTSKNFETSLKETYSLLS